MEVLRYFIGLYCFIGVFIAGGLFFKNRRGANLTISAFILFFTLELIDFLYTTSNVVLIYPEYFLFIYPICFLFGPALWLHFQFVINPARKWKLLDLLHLIPFVLFVVFAMLPLYSLTGDERLAFTRENFMNHMMPLNYLRTSHVAFYGLAMIYILVRKKLFFENKSGIYLTVIAIIYLLTAVLQSYLTAFADSFRQFSLYFFLASTITLIAGIVLYRYPEILQKLQQKYFNSSLKPVDVKRISTKINEAFKNEMIVRDNQLNLTKFCDIIEEKPHHVSQTFSEIFRTSFSSYLNENRIKLAKILLENPEKDNLKILAIAFECGFNNNVSFNKAFVKYAGITPGKYRKERKI